MSASSPFFSIIIPVYNGEKYLSETIESVLRQQEKDWELIIVDDCSKDSTPDILKSYKEKIPALRTFRNEVNKDIAFSLNRAIENAKGKWMVRLDADDFFSRSYLKELREEIECRGEDPTDFFSAWVTVVDGSSKKVLSVQLPEADFIQKMMPYENFLYHPATSFSKEAWTRVGGYPAKTPLQAEDTGMWLKFFEAGMKLHMIPLPLVYYRIHSSNVTSAKDSSLLKHSTSRQMAMMRQGREWRISLLLKQKRLKQARKELFTLLSLQKYLTMKNLNYLLMTFLPSSLVYKFMWEIRPRLRSWMRERRKSLFAAAQPA